MASSPTFTIHGPEPECPVCFDSLVETPSPRIYECQEGHQLCHKCVEKVLICPQCRKPMPVEKRRSFAAERMISEGKFVCPHTIAGCGGEFLKKEELSAHEGVCAFKQVTTARPLLILDLERRVLKDGFDREAFNSVLDKVGDRSIVVFCVSGPSREGKSYFLNQWLATVENVAAGRPPSANTGFPSREGNERVTVGIQLWSEPLIQLTPQGEIAILLIDTQGLADMQTTARHNAMLFTFSYSLASVMIHNQFNLPNKVMDENALVEFDCYSTLAHGVLESFNRERSAGSKLNLALVSKLLFLRRDFKTAGTNYALGLHSENEKPVGSKRNFYQDAFHDSSTGSEQRVVLKNIQKHFPHISTYLLPSPGEDFPEKEPTARFIEHMKSLVSTLMSEDFLPQEEKIKTVSGTEFKEIVASLDELFRSRDKYFVQATNRDELQSNGKLMTQINSERETWTQETDTLLRAHKAGASDEVLQKFFNDFSTRVTINLEDLNLGEKFVKQWRGFCEGWYANLKKRNELQTNSFLEAHIISEWENWTQEVNALLRAHKDGASDKILQEFFHTFSTRVTSNLRDLGLGDKFLEQWREFCEGWYTNLKRTNADLKAAKLKKIAITAGCVVGGGLVGVAVATAVVLAPPVAVIIVGSEAIVAASAAGGGFLGGASIAGITLAVKNFLNRGVPKENEDGKCTAVTKHEADNEPVINVILEEEEDGLNAAEDQPLLTN